MKFLVTGGAGFIGGNFLLEMVKKYPEDDYVCLDALTYAGNRITLKDIEGCKNFKFVHGNICDKELVDKLFAAEKFDYVINFAAETHVDRASLYPDIFVKTNIEGTQVLLDACRKYGIKRYHQVSTDEVYGDLPLEAVDQFFSEKSPIKPSSPYSASKAGADFLCLAYHRTFGLPVTVSRCSNNYGPYQYPEKLIPLMIQKAVHGKSVLIHCNQGQSRAPILALLVAKQLGLITSDFFTAERNLQGSYYGYCPNEGIRNYAIHHWEDEVPRWEDLNGNR